MINDTEHWEQLQELFHLAEKTPPQDRERVLAEHCGLGVSVAIKVTQPNGISSRIPSPVMGFCNLVILDRQTYLRNGPST